MKLATNEAEVLRRVMRWAEGDERVRAVLLNSSRAILGAPLDALSDYDVALLVADPAEMARDETWVTAYSTPLLQVRDAESTAGVENQNVMVLYNDGTKIDYSLWPAALTARTVAAGTPLGGFDDGFRVLLDKDGLTTNWHPPTHTAYIPPRPTAAEFQALIEEFWFVSTYVAKYLWRNEFIPIKVNFDYELKYLIVRRILEWRAEIDHDWRVQPGFFGRGLHRYLDPATWRELEETYVGPDREENWAALFRTIALFRSVAVGVARDLGYAYPQTLDDQMMAYLMQIRGLATGQGET
jgi:aminoglycoside 6-adenylyltransferase